jgi:branched-chain amino acid aminotransferase
MYFIIKDTLITAPVSERILDGVTRKKYYYCKRENKWERPIAVDELVEAAKTGLQENFFLNRNCSISQSITALLKRVGYFAKQKLNSPFLRKAYKIQNKRRRRYWWLDYQNIVV